MKKLFIAMIMLGGVSVLFIQGTNSKSASGKAMGDTTAFTMPDNVSEVVHQKCYGCHSPEGKSEKAKKKLMWDDLATLQRDTLISRLDDISEVTEEHKMPPKKFLEMKPEAALTDAQYAIIHDWADKTADALMGQ